MKYEHGSHAAYVLDRCRCDDCRAAATAYNRELRHRIEPAYVGAGPAREHIELLRAEGVGLKQVAKASGVSHGALSKLVYGTKTRGPSKRVRKVTLDKILAVTPAHAAGGSKVVAGPTWALIDEMLAAGVPKARIAEHLGQKGPGLQLSRRLVQPRNARVVRRLYDDWKAGRVELDRRNRYTGSVVVVAPPTRREPADVSELILELAEIVELRNAQPWRASAACRGRPTYLWFPARGDHETRDKGRRICLACIVRDQCRAEMLDERVGTYGGLTAKARRDLRQTDERVA